MSASIYAPRVRPGTPISERLRAWMHIQEDGCWFWEGKKDRDGYGYMDIAGKGCRAHRVSYTTWVGPITDGMVVDHICFNPSCINPEHLRLLTVAENSGHHKWHAGRDPGTHCKNGHERTPENLRTRKDTAGRLYGACLTCHRENSRKSRAARKSVAS